LTVFDNNTGEPYNYEGFDVIGHCFSLERYANPELTWYGPDAFVMYSSTGITAVDYPMSYMPTSRPNTNVAVTFITSDYRFIGNCTYHTDEYGGAYVFTTIYRYW
jgi:hypothetical protein